MTIVESGWNVCVWLVGVVSRRWVWLESIGVAWLVGVAVTRYIIYIDILKIIITFPYFTCISSFLAVASILLYF